MKTFIINYIKAYIEELVFCSFEFRRERNLLAKVGLCIDGLSFAFLGISPLLIAVSLVYFGITIW